MKEKKYIDIDGNIYAIKKFKKNGKLKVGYAYQINEKIVLPFFDDVYDGKTPGIYLDEFGKPIIKKPLTKKKSKKYSIDNVYTNDLNNLAKILNNEGIRKNDNDLLCETDDMFIPNISDDDNVLQQLIKKALNKKKSGLKVYENRFESPSDLNNTKRSLLKHGKMSYEKFIKLCNILDLNFTIQIFDLDGAIFPMNDTIDYTFK